MRSKSREGSCGKAKSTITNIATSQNVNLEALGDREHKETTDTVSCSVRNAENTRCASAKKVRHFEINGDICVIETVGFAEKGKTKEASVGNSETKTRHSLEHKTGREGHDDDKKCVCIEPLEIKKDCGCDDHGHGGH